MARVAKRSDSLLCVGLMSGTSADGVDAALVRIDERPAGSPHVTTLAAITVPYDAAFRARLLRLPHVDALEVARLDVEIGERLAAPTSAVLRRARGPPRRVAFVASHGHTAAHVPPAARSRRAGLSSRDRSARASLRERSSGATLQIGQPARIAERTGIEVVADFRPRDMAAGGQGAPLV